MKATTESKKAGHKLGRLIAMGRLSDNQRRGFIGNLKGRGRKEKGLYRVCNWASVSDRSYKIDLVSEKNNPHRIFALVRQFLGERYHSNKSKISESLYYKDVAGLEDDLRLSRHNPNIEGYHYKEGIIVDYEGAHYVDPSIPEDLRLKIESRVYEPEKHFIHPREWLAD